MPERSMDWGQAIWTIYRADTDRTKAPLAIRRAYAKSIPEGKQRANEGHVWRGSTVLPPGRYVAELRWSLMRKALRIRDQRNSATYRPGGRTVEPRQTCPSLARCLPSGMDLA